MLVVVNHDNAITDVHKQFYLKPCDKYTVIHKMASVKFCHASFTAAFCDFEIAQLYPGSSNFFLPFC